MTEFVLASFAPHVGDGFEVVGAPGGTWRLADAEPFGDVADPATHRSFSLIFRGEPEPVFAQQMVTLAHPALGEFAIFMTPLAHDADGATYEAVFN